MNTKRAVEITDLCKLKLVNDLILSPDGQRLAFTITEVDCWLLKPAEFDPAQKYPLLLQIHGGPFGMYAEALMHEFQLLAARGYLVLYTNPQGSAGYGDAFAKALEHDWGVVDFQ